MEWNKYKGGSHDIEETLGVLWAWRVSDSQEWAVRLKVPFNFHIAGDADEDSDKQGLGDIKLATGTAFRLSESWRTAAGVEMRFPSASDDLGDNVWRLQLFGAGAWDVTRWLTLSPSFEYNKSVAEEHSAAPKHFLEMYFPATYVLPRHWAVTARYEAKVNSPFSSPMPQRSASPSVISNTSALFSTVALKPTSCSGGWVPAASLQGTKACVRYESR